MSPNSSDQQQLDGTAPIFSVDASSFEAEVLKSLEPVLVEFRAKWCSQCAALGPMIKSMALEKQGDVKFVFVDIERNEALVGEYFVRAVPTLLLFDKGVVQETIVGKTTELDLRQLLERELDSFH